MNSTTYTAWVNDLRTDAGLPHMDFDDTPQWDASMPECDGSGQLMVLGRTEPWMLSPPMEEGDCYGCPACRPDLHSEDEDDTEAPDKGEETA